jgi:hypothetical protein
MLRNSLGKYSSSKELKIGLNYKVERYVSLELLLTKMWNYWISYSIRKVKKLRILRISHINLNKIN